VKNSVRSLANRNHYFFMIQERRKFGFECSIQGQWLQENQPSISYARRAARVTLVLHAGIEAIGVLLVCISNPLQYNWAPLNSANGFLCRASCELALPAACRTVRSNISTFRRPSCRPAQFENGSNGKLVLDTHLAKA
jgi:hypothetical protein